MNERIRELAEQAGFFPDWNYDHTKWHAAGYDKDFEKFATLIVKECALIAGLMEHEGRKNIGATILDRFEVKE